MSEYYFEQDGKRRGPIPFERLRRLAAGGKLQPTDPVWSGDYRQRVPASSVQGLFAPPPVPPEVSAAGSEPPPLTDLAPRTVPPAPTASPNADDFPQSYYSSRRYAHGNQLWWIPVSLGLLALVVLIAAWWWGFSGKGSRSTPEEEPYRTADNADDGPTPRGDGSKPAGGRKARPGSEPETQLRQAEARLQQAQAAYDADQRRYQQERDTAQANAGRRGAMGLPPQVVQPPDPRLARELEAARAAHKQATDAVDREQ